MGEITNPGALDKGGVNHHEESCHAPANASSPILTCGTRYRTEKSFRLSDAFSRRAEERCETFPAMPRAPGAARDTPSLTQVPRNACLGWHLRRQGFLSKSADWTRASRPSLPRCGTSGAGRCSFKVPQTALASSLRRDVKILATGVDGGASGRYERLLWVSPAVYTSLRCSARSWRHLKGRGFTSIVGRRIATAAFCDRKCI